MWQYTEGTLSGSDDDDEKGAFPPLGRAYYLNCLGYHGDCLPNKKGDFLQTYFLTDIFDAGDKLLDLASDCFSSYQVPFVATAVGQAKCAVAAKR